MTAEEILVELEQLGNEATKSIFMKHGAKEPIFGVKVGDLKALVKKIKKDHSLSLSLFKTNNSDAMYLACLIADEKKISESELCQWIEKANWYMLSDYAIPSIAAETPFAYDLAKKWIGSSKEMTASAGWFCLSNFLSIAPNESLCEEELSNYLNKIASSIHQQANRVRYAMNNFIIAIAGFFPPLTTKAQKVAAQVGKVSVDMGDTSCKVPLASAYIEKMIAKNKIGKKRKRVR